MTAIPMEASSASCKIILQHSKCANFKGFCSPKSPGLIENNPGFGGFKCLLASNGLKSGLKNRIG